MPEDKERPQLTVVADNSGPDIQRAIAWEGVERALVELAANILRVVRGAGRAYSIGQECAKVVEMFQAYRAIAGCFPSDFEISQALHISGLRPPHHGNEEYLDRQMALETILRGALQLTASRLVEQRTQEHAGESELMSGVRALNEVQAEIRRKREDEIKAARKNLKPGRATKATRKSTPNRPNKHGPKI